MLNFKIMEWPPNVPIHSLKIIMNEKNSLQYNIYSTEVCYSDIIYSKWNANTKLQFTVHHNSLPRLNKKKHSPDGVVGGILLKHSERNRYSVAALFGLFRHNVILSGQRTLLSFCLRELWRGSLSLRAEAATLPAPGLLQAALSFGENWKSTKSHFCCKNINPIICFKHPVPSCRIKCNIYADNDQRVSTDFTYTINISCILILQHFNVSSPFHFKTNSNKLGSSDTSVTRLQTG